MVYQAIAEYWINAHEEEYNVNVDIEIPGRSIPLGSNFNRQNHYGTKTAKVKIHTTYIQLQLYCWPLEGKSIPKQTNR